jgi:hypothetical protein
LRRHQASRKSYVGNGDRILRAQTYESYLVRAVGDVLIRNDVGELCGRVENASHNAASLRVSKVKSACDLSLNQSELNLLEVSCKPRILELVHQSDGQRDDEGVESASAVFESGDDTKRVAGGVINIGYR